MGKSRANKKKRIGDMLLEKHPNAFTTDFIENKKTLNELLDIPSKQLQNNVAGYITRAINRRQKQEGI